MYVCVCKTTDKRNGSAKGLTMCVCIYSICVYIYETRQEKRCVKTSKGSKYLCVYIHTGYVCVRDRREARERGEQRV